MQEDMLFVGSFAVCTSSAYPDYSQGQVFVCVCVCVSILIQPILGGLDILA